MASQAAVLSILIKANTSSATTGILRVNQQLGATEKSAGRAEKSTNKALSSMTRGAEKTVAAFEAVSKALVIGGGVGVAAGLTFAVKKAADFEQQLSSLGSVADATGKQMRQLRKQALKAGADTKFSALEAAQAQTELAKGGLSVSKIMKGGLSASLALAAAGQMDLADAASTTVNAIKLFGLRGKDAMKVADGFATAANRTTADVSDFALALKQGGSAAKTAGLTFGETVTALEALAEVGIKGSDAGTSLKTALIQLASPQSKEAVEKAKELGINIFDTHGKIKSLVDVSKELRDGLGHLNKQQRLQAATTLVGQDGFRALLALYDAGPKKIGRMERELGKQGSAAEVAKKKQDNLKGSLEQLGGSVETLGIQIGSELLPYIRDAADGLTDFANKVGRIFARDDLSLGEKFQKAFDLAKVDAKPLIDKVAKAIDDANVPEKIAAAVSAATPLILKGMAFAGITAAKTFVGAFADSNVWGKLALGTFLIRKLGLGGLLTGGLGKGGAGGGLGGAASMAKPVPVFVTNPAGVGGGGGGVGGGGGGVGGGGKVKGVLKGAGKLGGRLAALDLVINLVDQRGNAISAAINTAHDLTFGIVPKVNVKTSGEKQDVQISGLSKQLDAAVKGRDLGGIQKLTDHIRSLADESRDFGNQKLGARFDELASKGAAASAKLGPQLSAVAEKQRKAAAMSDNFAAAIKGLRLKGSKDFDGLVSKVTFGAGQILKVGGEKSTKTREAVAHQFALARKRVQTAMDDQVLSVKKGGQLMHDLAVEQLALYGIKAGRVNVVLAKGAKGQMRPTQRGAYINEGKAHGDSVPAILERGEYVLNRKAVAKVGKDRLDRLNYMAAPRFQKGGAVGMQSGGSVTGDTDFLPAVMNALKRMSAAAGVPIFVQSGRRTVAEQLAQGPSTPGHPVAGPNGPHVRGVAADITPGFGTFGKLASRFGLGFTVMPQEPWHIQLLKAAGAAGAGAAAFKGLGRPQIMGPASAGLEAAQGALDRIRSAANASVAAVAGNTANGPESAFAGSGVGGGTGADLMKAISKARGWSFSDWWALDGSETSHGRNLSNPTSSARLRGQFLDSNWGKYGPGSDPRQNPSMAQQIQSMAQYIAERYGNPSKAWAFHQAHNFYAKGGLVGMQKGGNPFNNGLHGGKFTHLPGGKGKTTLGSALHKVRHSRNPKVRKAAVDKMLDKIKKLGLPKSMSSQLAKYSGDADTYGDYATRAEALTVTPDDGSDPVQGVVKGKTQTQWLTAQLDALFKWRNTIIRAEEAVVARREQTAKLIEKARKRLATVRHDIAVANKTLKGPKGLEKQLATLQKHPKRNKAQIKKVKGLITAVNRDQRGRGRVRDALKDRILPALTGKRSSLNDLRGDLLSNLETVQGPGSPMKVLRTPPAVGVLGGSIFDVQMTLKGLNAPKANVTDTGSTDTDTTGSDALSQLLADANKRTAVSQAQYKVFDAVRDMQQFATGGIVQGRTGQATPAIVHAGEGVFTRDQMAAMGGGGNVVVHNHYAPGMEWLDKFVTTRVERTTRSQARSARTLPGRPGGLR